MLLIVSLSGLGNDNIFVMKCFKGEVNTKEAIQSLMHVFSCERWFVTFINSVCQVNRELKKLLVASVGDDLQYHFERLAREKNQLILENEALGRNLAHTAEQLERMSIQCDVWRSKFLASRYDLDKVNFVLFQAINSCCPLIFNSNSNICRQASVTHILACKNKRWHNYCNNSCMHQCCHFRVMAEELTNARVALQRQTREAQGAIQDLLLEREEFSRDMVLTHR